MREQGLAQGFASIGQMDLSMTTESIETHARAARFVRFPFLRSSRRGRLSRRSGPAKPYSGRDTAGRTPRLLTIT